MLSFYISRPRVKTIKDQLNCLKKCVCSEIGALFHSLHRRVKMGANFKINKFLQAIQSFFYCLNSRVEGTLLTQLLIFLELARVGAFQTLSIFLKFILPVSCCCLLWECVNNHMFEPWQRYDIQELKKRKKLENWKRFHFILIFLNINSFYFFFQAKPLPLERCSSWWNKRQETFLTNFF